MKKQAYMFIGGEYDGQVFSVPSEWQSVDLPMKVDPVLQVAYKDTPVEPTLKIHITYVKVLLKGAGVEAFVHPDNHLPHYPFMMQRLIQFYRPQ